MLGGGVQTLSRFVIATGISLMLRACHLLLVHHVECKASAGRYDGGLHGRCHI